MRRRHKTWGIVVIATLMSAGIAGAQPAAGPPLARQILGSGAWVVTPRAAALPVHGPRLPEGPPGTQRWHANVTRADDNSISGRVVIEVGGQAAMRAGALTGRIARGTVWGEIRDDDGHPAGTFEGKMTATGFQGTFTTRTDEVGTWSWDGPLPQ